MTKDTMQFSAETSKVLKLMIHSLYTNKDIFLRELVSNASDACDKLRYESAQNSGLIQDDAALKITIMSDEKANTITITDNGIGMNKDDLIQNIGTIAHSGTQEFLDQLTGDKDKDVSLIGQFGVGFYSAFMVADKVLVTSRKAGEEQGYLWESDGEGEFSITELEGKISRGTSITLQLSKENAHYTDKFKLKHIIETYSDHISFPIAYVDAENNEESLNDGSALWTRSKTEITKEQYQEFYHHVAHSPDEPWLTLHTKAEGKIEYTNLLFIPSIKPFDLFHPERRRRVKLYVKRVFITDENVDIVPAYMRFLRGIVDSQDLPLNISRETLQKNPILDKIRESIVKKVLGELKKRLKKNAEEYDNFWEIFGGTLKEGLCEAIAPKEQILEVCRFYSSTQEGRTTLDAYIERMGNDQESINYITGDRIETLRNSPQLEGFKAKGIEVLLLNDHVDDFWINVVQDYKGKNFRSVMLADNSEAKNAEDTKDETAKQSMDALLDAFKTLFPEELKDVRTTHKLTETAVCLAIAEGDMDMRMERFLRDHQQLNHKSQRILEVNPNHVIIQNLAQQLESGSKPEDIRDAASLLLDQAKIVEGEEIEDPAAFSRRLSAFMEKGLAA